MASSMSITRLVMILFLLNALAFADVLSTKGVIEFDVDSNGVSEMTLNAQGLAISANLHADQVVIAGANFKSTLSVNGTIRFSSETLNSDAILPDHSMIFVDTSMGNVNLTLPYAGNVEGRKILIKKVAAANRLILKSTLNAFETYASNLIVNETTQDGSLPYVNLMSSGNNWWILESNAEVSYDFWEPTTIPMLLWLDASDESTISRGTSDNVYQWNDKSGNDNHAVQTDPNKQPKYVSNDFYAESNPSVFCNNLDQKGVLTPSLNVLRMYIVTSYLGGTVATFNGYNSLVSGPGANGQYRVMGNVGSASLYNVADLYATTAYLNGASINSATLLPLPMSLLRIEGNRTQTWGIGYNQLYTDRGWGGPICEVIFTDATESVAERQKIEGYLAWKWGIQARLEASHPYYTHAP